MPTHAERREIPYTPEQMFDLVADIERYPEFLPWCLSARVRRLEADASYADIEIGFKVFRERFTTHNVMDRPRRIDVRYHEGPFKHLDNHWLFEPAGEGRCRVEFYIDFEFRARFLQKAMTLLFNEAVRMMVSAFVRRARQVYGPPPPPRSGSAPPRPRPAAPSSDRR